MVPKLFLIWYYLKCAINIEIILTFKMFILDYNKFYTKWCNDSHQILLLFMKTYTFMTPKSNNLVICNHFRGI